MEIINLVIIIIRKNTAHALECDVVTVLTHWGRDQMEAISQTTL